MALDVGGFWRCFISGVSQQLDRARRETYDVVIGVEIPEPVIGDGRGERPRVALVADQEGISISFERR